MVVYLLCKVVVKVEGRWSRSQRWWRPFGVLYPTSIRHDCDSLFDAVLWNVGEVLYAGRDQCRKPTLCSEYGRVRLAHEPKAPV